MMRRLVALAFVLSMLVARLVAQPPATIEEFVPIDQLPPSEQLPGGVFVVIAYGFIWIAAMAYLGSIWRRLGRVQNEIETLRQRAETSQR
jgi:hypothetical protein